MALALVESGLRLDIHRLVKGSIPGDCRAQLWQWWRGEMLSGSICFRVVLEDDSRATLILDYLRNGRPTRQDIRLRPVGCRFGGVRWYAVCPRTGRRASKLYLPAGESRFLSRNAYGLAYRSQRDSAGFSRDISRRNRLLAKLKADDPDYCPRPKWMRTRTYNRLTAHLEAMELRLDGHLARYAKHLGALA
ncbi:hypothetical protein [Prosthecodimorpha staleyi]|uniref:Uncharacterized protein n=1 Tax=Prosthecodimorpha staleyi TaxID=2840188 RepID=A0A947GGY6_9HYPH|nr:hypothetical protein [Prosthecodimorpha staleyi]MBT9293045.1 hypothetical protein [Prosthecodimorpha staleyi]